MTNRIKKETAELIALPPMTWYTREIEWLIKQDVFAENFNRIPIHEELAKSIAANGIQAPLLVMPNWYPICGSQRLRAGVEIAKTTNGTHPILKQQVRVCRFDKEYWNVFHLWSDEEFRSKAIQVYFQMIELTFKSIHFIEDDPDTMIKYETEGDKLRWKARDG